MAGMSDYAMPAPVVVTPFHYESTGRASASSGLATLPTLGGAASTAWTAANKALFYPFRLTGWAIAYQLLFWVGATSSGNLDVGIFDSNKNKIVSAGSTAMSATVNTVQELNITDTVLAPGEYLLGAAVDNTTGTVFAVAASDEISLSNYPIYEQASLTAAALTDPAVPVPFTGSSVPIVAVGIQLRSVF